jgi:AraC-like DNA-binding protein
VSTPIPRLTLVRAEEPTIPLRTTYEPLVCLVVQGRKRAILGERIFDYGRGTFLVVTVDLPVVGEICEANAARPYLAVSLALEPAVLASVILEAPDGTIPVAPATGMAVDPAPAELVEAFLRLVRLLERPRDIPVLAPLIEREILYRLLQGEAGPMLRQIAFADSGLSRISRSIAWIRRNFDRPIRIAAMADLAGMSPASFHRHFRAVTATSPLQFQKAVRLQEARRLLLSQQADAGRVGFAVGYESASQFSRDYRRFFGAPPARDAVRLRAHPALRASPPLAEQQVSR